MNKYFLATNEIDIFHYGALVQGQVVFTGQPKLFYFDTENELITALENYDQIYKPLSIDIQ
jgi:hypothetical protein